MSTASIPAETFRVSTRGLMRRSGGQILLAVVSGTIGLGLISMGLSRPEANCLAPGALFFFGGLAAAIHGYYVAQKGVREFDFAASGLAWEDENGRHRAAWDEVVAVNRTPKVIFNGFVHGATTTLTMTGGRSVVVDHTLERYDLLADLLQQVRASQVLPGLMAELDSGRPVGFGAVSVDRDGIEYQGRHRPWGTIVYAFDSGCLVMVPADGVFGWSDRTEVRLAEVPDAIALAEVLARFQSPTDPFQTIPASDRGRLVW